jgi:hypothetical protein
MEPDTPINVDKIVLAVSGVKVTQDTPFSTPIDSNTAKIRYTLPVTVKNRFLLIYSAVSELGYYHRKLPPFGKSASFLPVLRESN